MSLLNEVTHDDISRLTDIALTDLVRRLVALECVENGIAAYQHVNLRINIPDGGEDGRVFWHDGPASTPHLPTRICVIQVKVRIGPTDAGKEVIGADEQPKPRIRQALQVGGSYLLVCGNVLEQQGLDERAQAIRDNLYAAGHNVPPERIRVLDANQLRDWANGHVSAIAYVLGKAGRLPPESTDTWEGVSNYPEHSFPYARGDAARDAAEHTIREFLNGSEKVARVYGLAGLGKTRVVIEAARPSIQTPKLRSLLFADARSGPEVLVGFSRQCRQNGVSGTLVIDNCDSELHDALQREVRHPDSNLRLLSIGNDPPPSLSRIPQVELLPLATDVIKVQIKSICPALPDNDVDFIAEQLAEGFPQMAVLLAESRLNEVHDIREIVREDLVARLLGIDPKVDAEIFDVLRVCAIFERLGFEAEMASEYKLIANFEGIDPERFYAVAAPFIRTGIINRAGRFIEIRPKPLAWRLAADWWGACSPEKITRMIGLPLSEPMTQALCGRIRMLDRLPEIVKLTANLCGTTAPFGQAELLNSETGSRLFRAFCEVNPQACATAIRTAFQEYSPEDLKKTVGPGRRNLVWALERLCFWDHVFASAARTLAKFAEGESEHWSNNATGILVGFFSPLLSGTQAGPSQRLALAEELLSASRSDAKVLGVKCLSAALRTSHYSRMAGSEQQGSRSPQSDWKPRIWQELFDYWDAAVVLLVEKALPDAELKTEAVVALTANVRGLFLMGRLETLERLFTGLLPLPVQDVGPRVLDTLRTIERYDVDKAPSEAHAFLDAWTQRFIPPLPEDQLLTTVARAPWDHEKDARGDFVDVSATRAIALAEQFATAPRGLWLKLDDLLFDEQRQTYVFARLIGGKSRLACRFAIRAMKGYLRMPRERWNPSFLAGLAEGIRQVNLDKARKLLYALERDSRFTPLVVPTAISIGITGDILELLRNAARSHSLAAQDIRLLAYGRATDAVATSTLGTFCVELAELGAAYAWTALEVIEMHCHGHPERRNQVVDALAAIVSLVPLDKDPEYSPQVMDMHHFEEAAKWLILNGRADFRLKLAQRLAAAAAAKETAARFADLAEVAKVLLKEDPTSVWPVLAEPLLSEEWGPRYAIAQLLSEKLGSKDEDTPISHVPPHVLLEWCKAHGVPAASALIEHIPLFDNTGAQFSSTVMSIIDSFPEREVLSSLHVNMFSFSWSGSPVGYYRRLASAITGLATSASSEFVKDWARRCLAECEQLIARQLVEDEERR